MMIARAIIGLGTAALGFLMFNGSRQHYSMEAFHQESHMVEEDHLHHTLEVMGDYSDRPMLNNLKHNIFNAANFHFITRPWIHVKNFFNSVTDNIIPLGLGIAGFGFAFPETFKAPFKYLAKDVVVDATSGATMKNYQRILGGIGSIFSTVGGAIKEGILKPVWGALRHIRPPNLGGPTGVLAATALAAMGIYMAGQFKRELTEESRDTLINYLHPPGAGH